MTYPKKNHAGQLRRTGMPGVLRGVRYCYEGDFAGPEWQTVCRMIRFHICYEKGLLSSSRRDFPKISAERMFPANGAAISFRNGSCCQLASPSAKIPILEALIARSRDKVLRW